MAVDNPASEPVIFSSEDRIKQLAEIDKNIASLLRSAGQAVQALSRDSGDDGTLVTDEEARATFTTATSQYFSLLSSVDVNLRRQIWALEEANIIAPAPTEKDGQTAKDKAATEPGGIGSLDVGWLNSRNDQVGKEMEAELWAKASSLMASLADTTKKEGTNAQAEVK